jgi:protein SCO1/2
VVVRAAALAVALTLLTACGGTKHAAVPAPAPPASRLHGLVPQPIPRTPSFTLTDTAGRPFSFAVRTRGKLAYLYFGYTHCPDACPTTMSDLAAALNRQPADIRRRVEVVFVTVDPRRDTERVLRAWLNHFNPAFVGLRGTQNQIVAAEREAGVPLAPPEKVTGKNYSVAHSSLVLPFSPDGRAHVVYTQGFRTADYAHDMPLLLVHARSG